jgi:tRNA G37 N-methylase TrmD
MRIDILSIFPEFFAGPFDASLLGKARGALEARPRTVALTPRGRLLDQPLVEELAVRRRRHHRED